MLIFNIQYHWILGELLGDTIVPLPPQKGALGRAGGGSWRCSQTLASLSLLHGCGFCSHTVCLRGRPSHPAAMWPFEVPVHHHHPTNLVDFLPLRICVSSTYRLPATSEAQANRVSFCSSFLVCFIKATKAPLTDGDMLCEARCKMKMQGSLSRKQRNNAMEGTKSILLSFGGLSTFYGAFSLLFVWVHIRKN